MPTEYYQKIKEKLHKEARKRYQNFSKEKTEKKHQYYYKHHKNFPENKNKRLQNVEENFI